MNNDSSSSLTSSHRRIDTSTNDSNDITYNNNKIMSVSHHAAAAAAISPGTPSKGKAYSSYFGMHRSSSAATTMTTSTAMRWILMGFCLGVATMSLFQSVSMPTIRVEFEYEEGPPALHHFQVQQRKHKNSFILGSMPRSTSTSTSTTTKQSVPKLPSIQQQALEQYHVGVAEQRELELPESLQQQQDNGEEGENEGGEEQEDEEEQQNAERGGGEEEDEDEQMDRQEGDSDADRQQDENDVDQQNADSDADRQQVDSDADKDEEGEKEEGDKNSEKEEAAQEQEAAEQEQEEPPEDPDADNTEGEVFGDVDANGELMSAKDTNTTKLLSEKDEEEEVLQEGEVEPDFSNPGPPPKLDPDDAFAACILIKDDNHWLIEWLAYHYHVMPLRYLIVAIDPGSKTSPLPILQRYRSRKLMTISVWNDTMFMPTKINAKPGIFNNNTELMMHRVRQNNFYFKCMRTFKQRNREWLMLIDTDEYIVVNYASGLYYNLTKNIPITKPGNVLTFIKQHHQLTGENHTCSYMPRYMFGIKETDPAMVQRHMPPTMNGNDFLTQRFFYRNPRRMHNGKNLINIRKLPQIKTYTSVHHVSSYCPDPDKMRTVNHVKKALLKVHHYLGTPEQYFFRSDPRMAKTVTNKTIATTTNMTSSANNTNTTTTTVVTTTGHAQPMKKNKDGVNVAVAYFTRGRGRYNNLNARATYVDQGARAWIRGFIKDVGLETATALLEGVGKVDYEVDVQ